MNPAEKSADNTDTLILLVGRLEGKMDLLLARDAEQARKLDNHDERLGLLERGIAPAAALEVRVTGQEERLTALENDRSKVLGIWAVASLGLGGIVDHLFNTFWTK